MFTGLEEVAGHFSNVTAIKGDMLQLDTLLEGKYLERPIFLILQNSLGTIEGAYEQALQVAADEARRRNGELVLSLLRAGVLQSQGLDMYASLRDMVGEVDMERTDLEKGLFVSTTGYTSKWWTDEEIETFKKMGKVEDEVIEPEFVLLRLSFSA